MTLTKKQVLYRVNVRSRHDTHAPLRELLPKLPFRSIVRLGSTTEIDDGKLRIECNSVQSVKNSANKLLMKQCFTEAGVKTADWWQICDNDGWRAYSKLEENTSVPLNQLSYPIVAKSLYGSRGEGNYKLDTQQDLERWLTGKNLRNYIFEKFSTYSKEYRIHVTDEGCFYTCRKLLKNDAPEGTWQLHDDGTVAWILEDNPSFKKPATWNLIVEDCIKAKNALGLDICSFDVMVQGSSKLNPEWIIIESQSAPSFGTITLQKYLEEIPKVLKRKFIEYAGRD